MGEGWGEGVWAVQMPESIKDNVIEMIRWMPDDATVPDIMAELYVRQKIDVGLKQLDEGQSLSQEEVEQRLNKWLSQGGRY